MGQLTFCLPKRAASIAQEQWTHQGFATTQEQEVESALFASRWSVPALELRKGWVLLGLLLEPLCLQLQKPPGRCWSFWRWRSKSRKVVDVCMVLALLDLHPQGKRTFFPKWHLAGFCISWGLLLLSWSWMFWNFILVQTLNTVKISNMLIVRGQIWRGEASNFSQRPPITNAGAEWCDVGWGDWMYKEDGGEPREGCIIVLAIYSACSCLQKSLSTLSLPPSFALLSLDRCFGNLLC